jgi:hypothetical protein
LDTLRLARQMANALIFRWTSALLWTALTICLMILPKEAVRNLFIFFRGSELTDAAGHVILCAILVWLWYRALYGTMKPARALVIVVAIGLGLGVVTELAQLFIPSRGASLLDLLANVLGVVGGWGLGIRKLGD